MSRQLFVASLLAIGLTLGGTGCCSVGPLVGCGWDCGPGSACNQCGPTSDASTYHSYGPLEYPNESCNWCGGSDVACDACGLGPCARVEFHRAIHHLGLKLKRLLTCGSGCGELYFGEWHSDPPDPHDPCVDLGANSGPCGCGPHPSVPLSLWGRRFHCEGCSECTSPSEDEVVTSYHVEERQSHREWRRHLFAGLFGVERKTEESRKDFG